MKGNRTFQRPPCGRLLPCLLLVLSLAQLAASQQPAADPDAYQRRIMRARALAAAGNLPAARGELESLRTAATDESVREITLVLLMGIYFEQSDYAYAENLLTEAFRARSASNEAATRGYYLLAGQVINGVRSQLDRYHEFGLDTASPGLPSEATAHLDRLRKLVEQVVAQGRQLREENARSIDAVALLENASSARVLLARNGAERAQWQREVADVRQRLAGSNARPAAARAATPPAATQAVPQQTPAATPSPTPQQAANTQQPAAPAANPAGAAAKAAEPVEVGSLVSRATQTVAPVYPQTARAARVTGRVTVFLLVDEKGAVEAVRRTDGPELLRRAAEDAARRWKFRQTVVNDRPVRVTGSISFNFAL